MNVIHKESLCINCGCCVSECNAMESDPEFLGPQALAKGMRFVGDPRDGATVERLERYSEPHGIWECTRCYFCNERCPKGVDPRDAIAKLGAEAIEHGIDRDLGAKHAKWFVRSAETTGWLREEELDPEDERLRQRDQAAEVRATTLAKHGKVRPIPFPHTAKNVKEARDLHKLVREQDRGGALGHVQAEHALERLAHGHALGGETLDEIYARPNAAPKPMATGSGGGTSVVSTDRDCNEAGRVLQGLPRLALGEGARHLDEGARAARRPRARRARVGHVHAAPATSTRRSPTTTSTSTRGSSRTPRRPAATRS